ncbi:MAG: flagellar biosynthetic protein FliR [Myxococcota bacterium]|jgi:flagellar biosynthetic protein FliR|nr:flagellar biosynthetic protein FliR [Myxococcota bacterium]MEC9441855.1 flagellar biosynthetic protein FliR [Myxococcota bacterium]
MLSYILDMYIATWAAILFRSTGFFVLMPFVRHGAVPSRVVVALLIHLSLVVLLGLGLPSVVAPSDPVGWVLLLAPEFLMGAGLGVIVRTVLAAAQGMGNLVSQAVGLAFATFIDPGTQSAMQVVDRLTWTIMLLLLLATDAHLFLIEAMLDTFRMVPVGQAPLLDGREIAMWGGHMFEASLRLAAPALAVGFMIYTVLAILARVSPQMNLFAFGFALTIPGGFIALLLSSSHSVGLMMDLLDRLPRAMRAFVIHAL